jgi:hypothetical protein
VLLIQDVIPWFPGPGPSGSGADVDELTAQNKNWCGISSGQIGTTNLSQFKEIVIAAAQTQTFYENLFPAPTHLIHPAISTWVNNGGILSANLTDCASGPGGGGGWPCGADASTSFTFVAGVQHVTAFSQDNDIATPSHPIVADGLPCPSGNCGVIADSGTFADLDGWNFSSHGYFINLPAGTTVIISDPTQFPPQPVMVEYPFGAGTVIATLTTTEWRYVGDFGSLPQNKKLLANDIAYQDTLGQNKCPLSHGFWKTHPDAWPVSSLTLGSQTYSQAALLAILTAPVRGDASLILAHQLIAAKLNIANGSNPTPVSATIAAADSLLGGFSGKLPYHVRPSSATGQAMVNFASALDSYNNDALTPNCAP